MPALKRLRATHPSYIEAHKGEILFGGPARSPDGLPEEMMIVLKADDRAVGEAFIRVEPYNASGEVFAQVKLRPWSEVLPENEPGALAATIAAVRGEFAP